MAGSTEGTLICRDGLGPSLFAVRDGKRRRGNVTKMLESGSGRRRARMVNWQGEVMGVYKIFLVEDDEVIASRLAAYMTRWGLEVRRAADFARVMEEFRAFDPQLVLMYIGLPFYNGYHWTRQIRRESRVPVVFLSSASDKMNIVMAMDLGGDDFIPKPFDREVLMAKIQAELRRAYDFQTPLTVLAARGAVLNTGDASLAYRGERIELTKNDYRILETLMAAKGRVVAREELMERLWQTDSFVDENTLTVNVARLRRRLEAVGLVDFIVTKKGVGYLVEDL